MKPHRIFIAINLPNKIKSELLGYKEKWPDLPARWTSQENLHLTLAFLGNTSETELQALLEIVKRVGERHSSFELQIMRMQYGPTPKNPRMIWAYLKKSQELGNVQKDLEEELANAKQISYQPEKRAYAPHLTLARLKTFELQRMELEELPEVNEELSLAFQSTSIELMESKLKRSGAEYTILQTIPLSKPM